MEKENDSFGFEVDITEFVNHAPHIQDGQVHCSACDGSCIPPGITVDEDCNVHASRTNKPRENPTFTWTETYTGDEAERERRIHDYLGRLLRTNHDQPIPTFKPQVDSHWDNRLKQCRLKTARNRKQNKLAKKSRRNNRGT